MRDERRRARKQYRCEHCGELIEIGNLYAYARLTPWDHPDNESFGHYRAHLRCDALWGKIGADGDWTFWCDTVEWQRALHQEATAYLWRLLPGLEQPLLPGHPDGCECPGRGWRGRERLAIDNGPARAVLAMREMAAK